jgi:photosystem II stability/assembly factor-like uncharacterized protein
MKKYASLILLLLFLVASCKEHGGTSSTKEPEKKPETQLTACTGNENCKSGEICKDSVCVSGTITIACTHDNECQAGQYCSNGSCVAKEAPLVACASDADCSSGLKCDNGTCVIPPLTCNTGETLVDGVCKINGTAVNTSCKEGGLCNPGLACDTNNVCLGTGTWTHLGKAIPFPALATGAVARLGNVTYVGTDSGVFKTSDGGITWAPINNGLPGVSQVTALIIVGQNIYAGLASEGVYVTTDGGLNWSPLNSGLTFLGKYVTSLLKGPKGGPLYAGTMEGVFFTSGSDPSKWQSIGLKDLKVRSLAYYNSKLYAATFEQKGVFVYASGENWSNQNAGLEIPDTASVKPVLSLAVSNQFGLIAAVQDGIYKLNYKTAKSEPIWTPIFSDIYPIILTAVGNEIYVAATTMLYKYSDGKWLPIGIADEEDYRSITSVDDKIFITADKAIYKTTASNINWEPIKYSADYDSIADILYANNVLTAATYGSMGARGPAYSTDGGATWVYSDSDDKYAYIGSNYIGLKQNNNIIYAVSSTGYILQNEDGINWNPISDKSYYGTHDFIFFENSVFIASGGGVFKYENFAEWKDLKAPEDAYSLVVFNGSLYAGTKTGLYNLVGDSWALSGLKDIMTTALLPYGNSLYAGSSSGIYLLSPINDAPGLLTQEVKLEAHKIIDLELFGDNIYAATSFGLYKTPKGSNDWTKVNELSDIGAISSLFATKDMLFAGTIGLGVYVYAP